MRKIAAIAAAIMICTGAFAQSFGVVGGFTSSHLELKNVNIKNASGFNAGVAYRIPVALGLALQPELIYNVKGTDWESIKSNLNVGYIEVPVQLQWGIDLLLFRPYAFIEPFIGYAVNGNVNIASLSSNLDLSKMTGRFEYGMGVGAGIEVLKHFQVSFKYYWNFENCNVKDYISTAVDAVKSKNSFNGLMISAALFF